MKKRSINVSQLAIKDSYSRGTKRSKTDRRKTAVKSIIKTVGVFSLLVTTLVAAPLAAQPTTVGDSAVVVSEVISAIDILENDIDNGNGIDAMSLMIVDGPENGTVMVDLFSGDVIYTSNQGYVGSDSFTYKVADYEGTYSDEATVSINVLENLAPLIESFWVVAQPNGTHKFSGVVDDEQLHLIEFYVGGVLLPHSAIESEIYVDQGGNFSFTLDLEGETGDAIIHAIDSIGQMSNIASVEVD